MSSALKHPCGVELGGGQAIGPRLGDQQLFLPDRRPPGVAVLGIVMFASFGVSLDDRLADLHLPPDARQQLEGEKLALGAAEAPEGLDAGSRAAVERSFDEAFVSGYRVVMLVGTVAALASALGAALLVEGIKPSGEREEAGTKTLAA